MTKKKEYQGWAVVRDDDTLFDVFLRKDYAMDWKNESNTVKKVTIIIEE